MGKGHGVSGKTHTQQQLNDYANQHNPNNPAYWADRENQERMDSQNRRDEKYKWAEPDLSYCWDKDSE